MAGLSFNGKDMGIITSLTHSVSANERDRTSVGATEHIFGPGVPEQEISIEGLGSGSPVAINETGLLEIMYSEGGGQKIGLCIVTEFEETDEVDDGTGYSATFKPALAAALGTVLETGE